MLECSLIVTRESINNDFFIKIFSKNNQIFQYYTKYFRLYVDFFASGSDDEVQFFKDQLDAGYGFAAEYEVTAEMMEAEVFDILELDSFARAFAVSNTSEFFDHMLEKFYPEKEGKISKLSNL